MAKMFYTVEEVCQKLGKTSLIGVLTGLGGVGWLMTFAAVIGPQRLVGTDIDR